MGSREEKKTLPQKALRRSLTCSQNKVLSKYQKRASRLHIGPSPARGREAGLRKPEPEDKGYCNLGPRKAVLHQTASRLPVANHVFLGSGTVDICQEGGSLRPAPQRRRAAHLRQCSHGALGKPRGWTMEVIETHGLPGAVQSPSTRSSELLRPGQGTKRTPPPHLSPCRVPRTRSGFDLGRAQNAGPTCDGVLAEHPEA